MIMVSTTELLACAPCYVQLKDLLDGAEAEAASSGGGAAEAPAGAEQVAAQVEQLQVAEVRAIRTIQLELFGKLGGGGCCENYPRDICHALRGAAAGSARVEKSTQQVRAAACVMLLSPVLLLAVVLAAASVGKHTLKAEASGLAARCDQI
jgi:hypothetical protein